MKGLAVVVVLMATFVVMASADPAWYTCYINGASATVKAGQDSNGVAEGYFDDTIDTKGYGRLVVTTSADFSDADQMYCAGYLEGYMSALRIRQFFLNFWNSQFNSTNYYAVLDFAQKNMDWTNRQVQTNTSAYWVQVGLVMSQMRGLTDGYNAQSRPDEYLNATQIYIVNMLGDLDDLIPALNRQTRKAKNLPVDDLVQSAEDVFETLLNTHCSAIVKATEDGSDLFAAQEMWSSYYQMLSVYKSYTFPLSARGTASKFVSFASYPGLLSSEDDFYGLDTGLVVMETTNAIFNLTLYDAITPSSVMCWIRTIVSNRMTSSGKEWVEVMAQYNSGTYNNQWMIVDYKLWKKGSAKQAPNTLWIGSQIPGAFETADVTDVLNSQGYWASYNVPFFKDLFVRTGYAAMEQKYGDHFSYTACPRARIFRRDQGHVKDLGTLQHLMRSNDWKNDPLALDCPYNQIASRGDLAPVNNTAAFCAPRAFGAINAKATSGQMWQEGNRHEVSIIGGPTDQSLAAFQWTSAMETAYPNVRHWGQPRTFAFDWFSVTN